MFKYINIILSAILLLSACTKSEVQHEDPAEIGFAPAARNVTKAVMTGTLDDNVSLGVWANWNGAEGEVETGINDYSGYSNPFLVNASFSKKGDNWAGTDQAYLWPTSGALVFAGYTKSQRFENNMNVGVDEATYDFSTNSMTLDYSLYPQLQYSFDLCWFERTAASYNNRTSGNPVEVTLHHAMTWLTINVKGDAATAPEDESKKWKITDMRLLYACKQAVCTCSMKDGRMTAQWELADGQTTHVYLGKKNGGDTSESALQLPLTQEAQAYEAVTDAVIVIPQTPLKLEVTYQCPTASGYTTKTATVDLTLTGHKDGEGNDITEDKRINMWEAGKHYIYTLVFRANEILVAPSYGDWASSDQTITVE